MIIVWHVNPEEQHALDFKYSNPPQKGMCTYPSNSEHIHKHIGILLFCAFKKKHIHHDFMFVHFVKIDITKKKTNMD